MRPARIIVLVALAVTLLVAPDARAIGKGQVPGLQVALRARGLYLGQIDGIAGPMTAGAVRKFQRQRGLQVDGIAGPRTRRALGRLGRPLFGARLLR
ncbi:MAG: peptidoglycan-binding domain-containing protein, partial [Gaiellaceae bacterium]